jgi:hypothetical protein
MLHDFVHLEEGDWVIQNGANSSVSLSSHVVTATHLVQVGQAVIQIAASMGVKSINFLRDRSVPFHLLWPTPNNSILSLSDDLTGVARELQVLGATHVLTYDALANEATRKQVQEWTGGKVNVCGAHLEVFTYLTSHHEPIRLGLNCVG